MAENRKNIHPIDKIDQLKKAELDSIVVELQDYNLINGQLVSMIFELITI